MIRTLLFSTLAGVLSVASVHAQQQPQQVAFIGDEFTYQWGTSPEFQAHKNWLPLGSDVQGYPGHAFAGTSAALTALQGIIRSGKKPIIHLIVGEADSEAVSPGNEHSVIFAGWAQNFEEIIRTAQEAKLPIIVGTIPYSFIGDVSDMNQWIFVYCAAHNIPVVNYAFALNQAPWFQASGHGSVSPGQPQPPQSPAYWNPTPTPTNDFPEATLTSQGYDLITDMASVAIGVASGQIKLKGGYLGTVYFSKLEDASSVAGANSGVNGGIVQFTPYGQYTDGSTHVFNNADINGHIGTFTTSSEKVILMDQNGLGTALDAGTANVKFATPAGITLNAWTWTTAVYDKCGCTTY